MLTEDALKGLGLAPNQIKTYLATLELGSASVYKISQKAALPRSTTYEVLEHLHSLGLVTKFEKKNIICYNAEDPKKLVQSAFQRAELLQDALPELRALFSAAEEKPTVRSYVGVSGLKVIYEELIEEAHEINGFGAVDDIRLTLNDYFKRFVVRRVKKKMPVHIIVRDGKVAQEFLQKDTHEIRQTKILVGDWDVHGFYYIWKDKVALISFQKDLHSLIIRNEAIAKMIKATFDVMWEALPYIKPL
jgi:sugar-specific transcriptional regulator TrmB